MLAKQPDVLASIRTHYGSFFAFVTTHCAQIVFRQKAKAGAPHSATLPGVPTPGVPLPPAVKTAPQWKHQLSAALPTTVLSGTALSTTSSSSSSDSADSTTTSMATASGEDGGDGEDGGASGKDEHLSAMTTPPTATPPLTATVPETTGDAIESLAPLFASGRDEHSHVSSEPADELQSIYEWCATLEAPHPLVSEIVQGAGAEGIDIKELHSQMLCQSCELVDELYLRGLALSTSPLAGKTLAARTALNHYLRAFPSSLHVVELPTADGGAHIRVYAVREPECAPPLTTSTPPFTPPPYTRGRAPTPRITPATEGMSRVCSRLAFAADFSHADELSHEDNEPSAQRSLRVAFASVRYLIDRGIEASAVQTMTTDDLIASGISEEAARAVRTHLPGSLALELGLSPDSYDGVRALELSLESSHSQYLQLKVKALTERCAELSHRVRGLEAARMCIICMQKKR